MTNFIERKVKVDISKTKNKAIIKMMSPVNGMILTPVKRVTSPMGENYYICAETKNKCIYEEVLVLQKGEILKIELEEGMCVKMCPHNYEIHGKDTEHRIGVGSLACKNRCKHLISWDEKRLTIVCGYEGGN